MGCEKEMAGEPLWRRFREDFPVTQELVYLNHAAVSPLCRPAWQAMRELNDDVHRFGSLHYSTWLAAYEGLRSAAARLIGADAGEIAQVKNTSEGLLTVALGLDWRPGDRIVGFEEEFPANYYPWKRLEEQKGVHLELLSASDPLDRIDAACRGARLLAISFVQYLSGRRADLEAIGEICHRHGCLFVVDAIQGLGAFPLDVRKARIHALAADGHKWLLGPEGCGILYIQRDLQDSIEPTEFGWTNRAHYADYTSRDMTLRPDAGRYECGTLNTVGCFGLRAAIEFLLSVGIECIARDVAALGDRIAAIAASKGYELLGERTPATRAGIVSFRKHGLDARAVVSRLKEAGVIAAPRGGWVRTSPHFYISPDALERVAEALP
ncbi:MAG TPA: aminotransferase class V-fold PLP-dependent enzyme [Bryobacteraceae bacterium]|nr:aminotransferase class V-fold PLP-dependent enzyme [Bryobacteraceae bacterium]